MMTDELGRAMTHKTRPVWVKSGSPLRVLVAGASGALGVPLVRRLVEGGHKVFGTGRGGRNFEAISALGATPVVMDALAPKEVLKAVRDTAPDVVIHNLTAIPSKVPLFFPGKAFELTNRLRTEGTEALLEASEQCGVKRVVGASITFCLRGQSDTPSDFLTKGTEEVCKGIKAAGVTAPIGTSKIGTENELAFVDNKVAFLANINQAVYRHERLINGFSGDHAVLRFGFLYGPGTAFDVGGETYEGLKKGELPIVGKGTGVWSLIHVEEAAEGMALVATASKFQDGTFNVVDPYPVTTAELFESVAQHIGGPKPKRVPEFLARWLFPHVHFFACKMRGANAEKIKAAYAWAPSRKPEWM